LLAFIILSICNYSGTLYITMMSKLDLTFKDRIKTITIDYATTNLMGKWS